MGIIDFESKLFLKELKDLEIESKKQPERFCFRCWDLLNSEKKCVNKECGNCTFDLFKNNFLGD